MRGWWSHGARPSPLTASTNSRCPGEWLAQRIAPGVAFRFSCCSIRRRSTVGTVRPPGVSFPANSVARNEPWCIARSCSAGCPSRRAWRGPALQRLHNHGAQARCARGPRGRPVSHPTCKRVFRAKRPALHSAFWKTCGVARIQLGEYLSSHGS